MVTDVSRSIFATQEAVFEVASAISETAVGIVTGEGTSIIASPPIMMPGMATPPCSPTTELVSSRKYKHLILSSTLLSLSL